MQKIRKIFRWLWNNKERMVLVFMICTLGYQVYKVVNPPETQDWKAHVPPRNDLPGDIVDVPEVPPPPPPQLPEDWSSLYVRNPFWFYARTETASQTGAGDVSDAVDISLERIMRQVDGTLMARLRTTSTVDWYAEGDSFQKYELLSIDFENKTAEVYSEDLGRTITLQSE